MGSSPGSTPPGVGLVLPPAVRPEVLWPAVEIADASGFDSVWVTDRTLAGVPWLDSLTLLGAVAARTRIARIGTSVLAVGRRNPVYTAHAFATAQFLSGGRLIAGIGLGGLNPAEYHLAEIAPARRAPLTDEYIGLLRRLWSEGGVTHDGPGYRCEGVDLLPRPETPIPIWVGGNSPGAHRRAGRLGDGWLSVFAGPDQFGAGWSEVVGHARAVGRDPADLTAAAYVFAAIGRTEDEAEAVLGPAIRSLFGAPLEQFAFACLCGTPERWLDTLGRFGEAGARHVNVLLYSQDLPGDVELISKAVLPRLDGAA
ncbi:LLM class flavin-dependent oxidoreductase [Pseudonocardia asaccharolytica]|uniref:N5,N10-methylene tetrahydromethanopterin reductase n=1 Tax=Pseudonocardia asaccharolytica DSM 44247 = NBRC 16224 TaxID=1123024 RepID=A0A511D763_9PSEU|nr:LLM class flavin-dependent oxidoreductase [Pseudonocardia asaccharolytica]GEL20630.1 N5,N10-methylene tetrahydromethanopterin reductase [Pseudonocardia asaccharolytica DSM 44247 = NBRC 16224]